MSSAVLDRVPNPLRLERTHVLMNKFRDPDDPDYKMVVDKISDILRNIRERAPLEQAKSWIYENHYNEDRLRIERLSGDPLPMDQCYINLALVATPRDDNSKQRSKDHLLQSEHFSLAARLKVEMPQKGYRVELSKLFEPRRQPNDRTKKPKRILIRGRAGVGKTTSCKKIVHDFIKKGMWQNLFSSIFWVPLRNLKTWNDRRYGLTEMLGHIYFQQHAYGASLASALRQHVEGSTASGTLFILDGLDEISELLDKQRNPDIFDFLIGLLNQTNVVIMTRPHVSLPHDFQEPDLELETIGFRSDQVDEYLKNVTELRIFEEIQSFLQKSPLMRSLVRIPIQLDALCIIWDKTLEDNSGLKTMTQDYKAIVERLWKKDIKRLKESKAHVDTMDPNEVEDQVKKEIEFLELLAFGGMYSNLIEFRSAHRAAVYKLVRPEGLPVYEILGRVSFLRTSDGSDSVDTSTRSHHFIHLTFQEYFAAKYFVRMWTGTEKQPLQCVDFNHPKKGNCKILPADFLKKNKYTARYNIMWLFIAGLLGEGSEENISSFFQEIDRDPVDVLGPAHQRLVMNCLNEAVSLPMELRKEREELLLQWVFFEMSFTDSSTFARESELPEWVLVRALKAPGLGRIFLNGFSHSQRQLSDITIAALVELLKDEDNYVRRSAAEAIGKQSTLSDSTMAALVELLKDKDRDVRSSAAEAISTNSALSDNILDALGIRIQAEAQSDSGLRQDVEPFYESFLRRSFNEHFCLFADKDFLNANHGSGLRVAKLENQIQFQTAVAQGREKLKGIDSCNLWSTLGESDSN